MEIFKFTPLNRVNFRDMAFRATTLCYRIAEVDGKNVVVIT